VEDIENSQKVLVEVMGEGSDFPRRELEAKARNVIDALQGKRMREKERHEASIRKILSERPPPSEQDRLLEEAHPARIRRAVVGINKM